jgi:hypothetical protein
MRPVNAIPAWAQTILNYVAPGKAWDGTPNQVIPPSNKIQAGLEPSERVPGPFFNWLIGVVCTHLIHLADVDVQNWGVPGLIVASLGPKSVGYCFTWDPIFKRLWCGGARLMFSYNGATWFDSVVSSAVFGLTTKPTTGMVVGVTQGLSPGRAYFHHNVDPTIWNNITLANSGTLVGARYDVTEDRFYFYGATNAGSPLPGIWTSPATMASSAQATVNGAAGSPGPIEMLAVSPTAKLAISSNRIWTTSAFNVSWTDRGPTFSGVGGPFNSDVLDLIWDPMRGIFVVWCDDGWIYKSRDGISWTLVRGLDPDLIGNQNCSAVNGGLYVQVVGNGLSSLISIVYSTDGGETWGYIPYPMLQSDKPLGVSLVDDRFVLMSTNGNCAFSLRLK